MNVLFYTNTLRDVFYCVYLVVDQLLIWIVCKCILFSALSGTYPTMPCKFSTMPKIFLAMSKTNYTGIYLCIHCIGKQVPSESVRHLSKWNFVLSGNGVWITSVRFCTQDVRKRTIRLKRFSPYMVVNKWIPKLAWSLLCFKWFIKTVLC